MAKVKLDYMSLSMRAEGSDDMVRELSGRFLDMADKYAAPGFYFPALPPSVFEDGCRDPEELNTGDMKPLTTPKEVAPGADWDVVAIYDDAGIPSIMHRFRRMSNKELFGGSDKPHPAFIIGGEVYDEIYISVYPNVMINGKPYSLPFQKPAGNITLDDFSKACFSKGEGWHPMTAAEWGFLANLTTDNDEAGGVGSSEWGKVKTECKSEMLKEYALFAGEEEAYGNDNFWANNAADERCPIRGGDWRYGEGAGVFGLHLYNPRSNSWTAYGGRSAFVKLPAEA